MSRPGQSRRWSVPVRLGVVVAAVVGLAGCGGGGDTGGGGGTDGAAAYTKSVEAPMRLLTNSAVAIGKLLARTNRPTQVAGAEPALNRQLDAVEEARQLLSTVKVDPAYQKTHGALIAAAAQHRRYLVLLGRAVSVRPAQGLSILNQARASGAQTTRAYRAFFVLAPQTPDAITGVDLADTSGVSTALRENASRPATGTPAPSAPAPRLVYSGPSFQTPTGNIHCEDRGSELLCSRSNDTLAVFLPEYGGPTTTGGLIASGGESVPYGSSWVRGRFRCESAFSGITCRSVSSGRGFFLSRSEFRDA